MEAQLQILNDSMVRACDWTKRQMQKIHENNRVPEKLYAQMRSDANAASKEILELQKSVSTVTELDDTKRKLDFFFIVITCFRIQRPAA